MLKLGLLGKAIVAAVLATVLYVSFRSDEVETDPSIIVPQLLEAQRRCDLARAARVSGAPACDEAQALTSCLAGDRARCPSR